MTALLPATQWHLERRLAGVYVTPEVFFSIVKHGVTEPFSVVEGLPADAEMVEADYDEYRGLFVFVVASSAFEPVPVRGKLPEVMVTFRHGAR
jgi:hypothetical protein